jgi:membrane protease YdiL (CAAX protease family)
VYLATFSPSFLKQYPQVNSALRVSGLQEVTATRVIIFELFYLLGFFITELFFRGFLLSVLFRKVGYAAVIPVAMFYVTIHFGKPLGETIGSFFGAIILGVIAIETKSIWGGVIVHAGIALLMEAVAAGGGVG